MARKPRVEYPGAVYHVMARSNRREVIFSADGDYQALLDCLGEACERTGWRVHAYVVMGNHYHLLLETPEANLVAGMKWLQGTFTQRHNAFHQQGGHLFQGRYKALVVNPNEPDYFRIISTYIHLNPVRAGLAGNAGGPTLPEFRWSSLPAYGNRAKRPAWLEVGRVLASLNLDDSAPGRRDYVHYIEGRARDAQDKARGKELAEEARLIRRGWCLGDEAFRESVLDKLDEVMAPRKRDSFHGAERHEHDGRVAERMLKAGLARLELVETELGDLAKNDVRKVALAGWLKARTIVSNRWVSERLVMGHEMNVSRAVKTCKKCEAGELVPWVDKLKMLECAD